MKNGKLDSNRDSGADSQTARVSLRPTSERRFLAEQAAGAKSAMIQTLSDMKNTVTTAADLRSCVEQHPWFVMASALAGGFVAGALVTPAAQKTSRQPTANSAAESPPAVQTEESAQTKQAFLFSTLVTVIGSILQTAARGWITAAVASKDPVKARTPLSELSDPAA